MFKKKLTLAHFFTLATIVSSGHASMAHANEDEFLGEMSLSELFAIDTDIAGNTARDVTEQPSIISVISRDQILSTGARDLIDVLRLVPGFGFAHDTAGINSIGFRGIWGHEGKIMLMIDGAPYNDAAWGNLQLGRHYPVELIDKIEIIRGPGAAKYGNYAELAMIKITTIGEETEGGYVNTNIRSMDNVFGSGEFTAMYGDKLGDDMGFSTSIHFKTANRTNQAFTDASGSLSTDQNNSPIKVAFFDGKVRYKDLTLASVIEQYSFEHGESLLQIPDPQMTMEQGYERLHLSADYSTGLTDNLVLNANVLYQETTSHDMVVKESRNSDLAPGSHYRIETDRTIVAVDALYSISDNNSVNFGFEVFDVNAESAAIGEYFYDPGHQIPGDSTELAASWFGGSNEFGFDQQSAFIQYEHYNDIANFTVGLRWADHSRSTEKVAVPRIGLSKKFGNFGAKVMYSEAFRTGDAEHLNLASTPLKPETLESTEVEFSYLHDTGLYTINFFKMGIQDSIVWNTDALTENLGEIVSDGFEASWLGKGDDYEQSVNIAYYQAGDESTPSQLANDGESFLGFPTIKATYYLNFQVNDKINISPTIMYENKKWWRVDGSDRTKDAEIDSVLKLNLSASYMLDESAKLLLSVHDILDEGYKFVQAYGQVEYPGDAREYTISYEYHF